VVFIVDVESEMVSNVDGSTFSNFRAVFANDAVVPTRTAAAADVGNRLQELGHLTAVWFASVTEWALADCCQKLEETGFEPRQVMDFKILHCAAQSVKASIQLSAQQSLCPTAAHVGIPPGVHQGAWPHQGWSFQPAAFQVPRTMEPARVPFAGEAAMPVFFASGHEMARAGGTLSGLAPDVDSSSQSGSTGGESVGSGASKQAGQPGEDLLWGIDESPADTLYPAPAGGVPSAGAKPQSGSSGEEAVEKNASKDVGQARSEASEEELMWTGVVNDGGLTQWLGGSEETVGGVVATNLAEPLKSSVQKLRESIAAALGLESAMDTDKKTLRSILRSLQEMETSLSCPVPAGERDAGTVVNEVQRLVKESTNEGLKEALKPARHGANEVLVILCSRDLDASELQTKRTGWPKELEARLLDALGGLLDSDLRARLGKAKDEMFTKGQPAPRKRRGPPRKKNGRKEGQDQARQSVRELFDVNTVLPESTSSDAVVEVLQGLQGALPDIPAKDLVETWVCLISNRFPRGLSNLTVYTSALRDYLPQAAELGDHIVAHVCLGLGQITVAEPGLANEVATILQEVAQQHARSRELQYRCMETWVQVCWTCDLCLGKAYPWSEAVRQDTQVAIQDSIRQALGRFPEDLELQIAAARVLARTCDLPEVLEEFGEQAPHLEAVLTEIYAGWQAGPLRWSWCDSARQVSGSEGKQIEKEMLRRVAEQSSTISCTRTALDIARKWVQDKYDECYEDRGAVRSAMILVGLLDSGSVLEQALSDALNQGKLDEVFITTSLRALTELKYLNVLSQDVIEKVLYRVQDKRFIPSSRECVSAYLGVLGEFTSAAVAMASGPEKAQKLQMAAVVVHKCLNAVYDWIKTDKAEGVVFDAVWALRAVYEQFDEQFSWEFAWKCRQLIKCVKEDPTYYYAEFEDGWYGNGSSAYQEIQNLEYLVNQRTPAW